MSVNGFSPMNRMPVINMRDTQNVMMSNPVTSTLVG